MDLLSMGLIFIVMIVAMYFLMIRPANKRMKDQQAQVAALEPGSRVVLTSGIFASVRHVGEKQMVVELAPDCVVTVLKAAIARPADADEEEFEYDDAPGLGAADVDPAVAPGLPSEDPLQYGTDPAAEVVVEETAEPRDGER